MTYLLRFVPVVLCRDDAIDIPTISCLHSLYQSDSNIAIITLTFTSFLRKYFCIHRDCSKYDYI